MRAKAGRNVATVRPSTGTVLVYGCGESIHQELNLKAKRNCAMSLGREGPGNCFTISGLLCVFWKLSTNDEFINKWLNVINPRCVAEILSLVPEASSGRGALISF